MNDSEGLLRLSLADVRTVCVVVGYAFRTYCLNLFTALFLGEIWGIAVVAVGRCASMVASCLMRAVVVSVAFGHV